MAPVSFAGPPQIAFLLPKKALPLDELQLFVAIAAALMKIFLENPLLARLYITGVVLFGLIAFVLGNFPFGLHNPAQSLLTS